MTIIHLDPDPPTRAHRRSLDPTPRKPRRDWFRADATADLQGFMLAAHKKRTAYEKERERYRIENPPKSVKTN